MPTNHSGKTDRRRLRQIGSSLTYAELAAMQPSRKAVKQPSITMEKRLQQLWADVIGIEASAINAGDNFLRLGGDSITAIRLVASARHQNLALTVANVFRAPMFENMAKYVKYNKKSESSNLQLIVPFSLFSPDIYKVAARRHAARAYSVDGFRVTDIYPCTALQKRLLALGTKKHGQYVSRNRLEHDITVVWPRTGITPSTVTRSAWALLTTQYTRSNDVLFAATVNGRQASIRGIENCVGPTISTIPIAVGIDWAETIEAFLARRQSEMMETVPHEQFGLQNIYRALGGDLDPRHI
ncbi:hypothetical protein ACKVWM_000045 [Pyricularia oryzae]